MQLVWLRNDLRTTDNSALSNACKAGDCCCVFVVNPEQWRVHNEAAIKLNFILRRLQSLQVELSALNIPLKIIPTTNYQVVPGALLELASSIGATGLWFNYEYPLNESLRDEAVSTAFANAAIQTHAFHGDVFHQPGTVKTQNDTIYHVKVTFPI